jgi:prepilin-type N-terminal cleavage/methylation domain-containing protein
LNRGFTLIETIIAIAIFAIIATGIYFSFANILEIFSASYLNLTSLSALDNELEVVRNMPYEDVGIQGGSPAGVISAEKNLIYGNIPFVVKTFIRNVDDPFDGLQGGSPNDTAPADYKLVEIEITCPTCPRFIAAKATTTVAPIGLETVTKKGTLMVKAFDASGQPISGANVSIINNNVSPVINISDLTDSSGILKLVDIATSSAGYAITVSKSGYSTDRTYSLGGVSNPNPLKPNATVLQQQTTEISFVIDRVSNLTFRTQDKFCADIGNIDFIQTGQKIIGTNPNVFKYSVGGSTNVGGDKIVSSLEFDTYDLLNQDAIYEISGFAPLTPIAVDPNGTYNLTWLMETKSPSGIIVTARNQSGQLINDAKVTISRSSFSNEAYTGRKSFVETDWSGGQYDSKSNNMATGSPAGELTLVSINGKYASMSDEWLISRTIDMGTSDTNFYDLVFNPTNQPPQTDFKIQIATNNDNSSWNFIGPDGTGSSFYTTSGTQPHVSHNNSRYMRYKVILRTENDNFTPSLRDLAINFNSSCIPDGQVYFSGLSHDTYTVRVEKAGYQTFTDTEVVVDQNWEDYRVILNAQ